MDSDYKKYCLRCSWNDSHYGCTCPPYEEVYQCKMYAYYHPEEVAKFEESMEKFFAESRGIMNDC